jgi:uncharacterized protein YaaR (DUF327 family)
MATLESAGVDASSGAALLNARLFGGSKAKSNKAKGVRNPQGLSFEQVSGHSLLEKTDVGPALEFAPSEEALIELTDAVRSAGDDLKRRPLQGELLAYKRAVRDFLNYVVENGYTVETTQSRYRESRGLLPAVQVKIIDEKLEKLASGILTRQIDELQLVSKIDELTGLLVDLTATGKIETKESEGR